MDKYKIIDFQLELSKLLPLVTYQFSNQDYIMCCLHGSYYRIGFTEISDGNYVGEYYAQKVAKDLLERSR